MPPMPAEFYVPAFGAMSGAIVFIIGGAKILWARYCEIESRLHEYEHEAATRSTRALVLNSEALNASTEAIEKLAEYVRTPGTQRRRVTAAERKPPA